MNKETKRFIKFLKSTNVKTFSCSDGDVSIEFFQKESPKESPKEIDKPVDFVDLRKKADKEISDCERANQLPIELQRVNKLFEQAGVKIPG